jgi:NitT/TauT family transport system substrate-binding protein/putative hydroxymethylpyrimidine transport system substrate-binding protein
MGRFGDEGIDLEIDEPSSTADGAKLLEAGRADAAILDINDLGLARERGLPIVAVAAIVQRPLAAVIAAGDGIASPADLDGRTVGVTGVPSDDAILDTVLASAGLEPDSVRRRTIGFQSVALLAAGRIDAATGFWNAEGVALSQEGIPTREFRVDELGAPRYPELVLALPSSASRPGPERDRACALVRALERGYEELSGDPDAALEHLLEAAPELDPGEQRAQLAALVADRAFSGPGRQTASSGLDAEAGPLWLRWAADAGIVDPTASEEIEAGFLPLTDSCRATGTSG